MHVHLSGVAFHVHCVGLGHHVNIGVGRLIVRFHHAYAIPSFLLDVVVRLCLVIVNSDCSHNYCMLDIATTVHLKCCPYTSSRLQERPLSAVNDPAVTKVRILESHIRKVSPKILSITGPPVLSQDFA